jgi:hypothetical protein
MTLRLPRIGARDSSSSKRDGRISARWAWANANGGTPGGARQHLRPQWRRLALSVLQTTIVVDPHVMHHPATDALAARVVAVDEAAQPLSQPHSRFPVRCRKVDDATVARVKRYLNGLFHPESKRFSGRPVSPHLRRASSAPTT